MPGRGTFRLLALDAYHDVDGKPDWEKTDIFVPNEYVLELSECLMSAYLRGGLSRSYRSIQLAQMPWKH